MKSLIMSISGTRGIIGENFDPAIALDMGMAFGTYLGKGPVIVGGDTRTSHDMLKYAVISGLTAVGTDVIDIGKVPTPTVQQMIRHYQAAGGIVVTASHNPVIWNGIKLMNKTGSFFDDDEYEAFNRIYKNREFRLESWDNIGVITTDTHALEKHVERVFSVLDPAPVKKAGLRVLIDANNGTGCLADPVLLSSLGVHYDIINAEGNGRFAHDPEPLQKNLTEIMTRLKKGGYDIGFVQDADADRLVILDENGRFIGEDYSLALCMDYLLSKDPSPGKKVVVNLSTSLVVEWLAKKHHASVTYTKIGETNVTQEIKRQNATVGGEGNGGVIFPKVGWGRDSLVGIITALKYLAESGKTVSQIVGQYPQYAMLREKLEIESREQVPAVLKAVEAKFPDAKKNYADGVKIMLDNGWVHVRPSNTEPIIRIFIEAETREKADALMEKVKQ